MACLPRLNRTRSWVPNKEYAIAADIIVIGIISDDFLFFNIDKVCCVYSLKSPWWGDYHKNEQNTFILRKIE